MEVILLDDASVDGSRDAIIEFGRKHNWPVLLNSENSGSPFKQWAKGVAMAKGTYVWIAESDDYCETNLLSNLVEILESDEAITLAYCQSTHVDENNEEMGSAKAWTDSLDKGRWAQDFVADGKREAVEWLSCRNTIPNASAVVFRRAEGLTFDDILEMRLCGDWIFWSRIARKGKVAFSAMNMNYYRTHSQTARINTKKNRQREEWYLAVMENIESSDYLTLDRSQIKRIIRSWSETVDFNGKYLIKYALLMFKKSKIGALQLIRIIVSRTMKKGGVERDC